MSRRSQQGLQASSGRRHVALTLPRAVKAALLEVAEAIDWSAGDYALAAAAEHGPALQAELAGASTRKRPPVVDPAYAALYLTLEEREELDEIAGSCGLSRSAFVTAVVRLALGEDVGEVTAPLRATAAGP